MSTSSKLLASLYSLQSSLCWNYKEGRMCFWVNLSRLERVWRTVFNPNMIMPLHRNSCVPTSINLPHRNPICLGTIYHETFEVHIQDIIFLHHNIGIFPGYLMGMCILKLHIAISYCGDLEICSRSRPLQGTGISIRLRLNFDQTKTNSAMSHVPSFEC